MLFFIKQDKVELSDVLTVIHINTTDINHINPAGAQPLLRLTRRRRRNRGWWLKALWWSISSHNLLKVIIYPYHWITEWNLNQKQTQTERLNVGTVSIQRPAAVHYGYSWSGVLSRSRSKAWLVSDQFRSTWMWSPFSVVCKTSHGSTDCSQTRGRIV